MLYRFTPNPAQEHSGQLTRHVHLIIIQKYHLELPMLGIFRKRSPTNTLNSAFEKMHSFLSDDDMQIRVLGPQQYSHFKTLSAIDRHHGREGEFGRSLTNPAPTNGPIGSISYLSNLVATSGHRIVFHRINTLDGIDVYEYASLAGDDWGLVFVDMYHSRKSKLAPTGLRLLQAQQLIGFNHFWDDFPYGFAEQKQAMPAELRFLYAPVSAVSNELTGRNLVRPLKHALLVQTIAQAHSGGEPET